MEENNVIIRIVGEADLSDANLQLRDLTNKGKELEKQMSELEKAEKADIANLRVWIKDEARLNEELNKTTASYKQHRKELQQNISANEKSIQTLKRSISQYNMLHGAGVKLQEQLEYIRNEMVRLADAGDSTSPRFIELADRAAELTDTIGDTQAAITMLASDTKNLDAAMQIGGGLAGTFTAATSAMALLSGESEELQQAFLKVQAAMSVLQGVQQVLTVTNKKSAANIVLRTAMLKIYNKVKGEQAAVTGTATVVENQDTAAMGANTAATTANTIATKAAAAATKIWNKVLLSNPVLLIVAGVATLVAGIAALTSHMKKSAEAARDFAGEYERMSKKNRQISDDADFAARMAEAEGKGWREVLDGQRQSAKEQLDNADALIDSLLEKQREAGGKLTDQEKEILQKAEDDQKAAYERLNELNTKYNEEEKRERRAQEQERQDAIKAAEEERRRAVEDAEKRLQDVRIELMKDGAAKEIAQITLNYQRQLQEIKGNSDAETALRIALEERKQQEIKAVQDKAQEEALKRQADYSRQLLANEVALQEQKGNEDAVYNAKRQQLEQVAELEIQAVERSEATEEEKAANIVAIELKLTNDLRALQQKRTADAITAATEQERYEIQAAQNAAEASLAAAQTKQQRTDALALQASARRQLLNLEEQETRQRYANGEMEYQEYCNTLQGINHQRVMMQIEEEQQAEETRRAQIKETLDIAAQSIQALNDIMGEVFGALSDNISAQIEQLDAMYTTDAEEAKENANKKYISEKELAKKKAALEMKQAKLNKANALFQIGINTAAAIMAAATLPPPASWIQMALVAGVGAAQLAVAAAKPLPQYAKGRKGGDGEYALVGEKGPELMYVPQGASIVPNNKLGNMAAWGDYGVPKLPIPVLPNIDDELLKIAVERADSGRIDYDKLGQRMTIDYDRLGQAVAKAMPKQRAVNVNVDRSGVTVQSGNDTHTYLNRKYNGAWN